MKREKERRTFGAKREVIKELRGCVKYVRRTLGEGNDRCLGVTSLSLSLSLPLSLSLSLSLSL